MEDVCLLFLDIDGVLNRVNTAQRVLGMPFLQGVDPELVGRLVTILEQVPECSVVVSSAWRQMGLDFILHTLEIQGELPRDLVTRFIGMTPYCQGGGAQRRGNEISRYLQDEGKGVSRYVILDDMDLAGAFPRNYVEVVDGLTQENVEAAIRILKGELHEP